MIAALTVAAVLTAGAFVGLLVALLTGPREEPELEPVSAAHPTVWSAFSRADEEWLSGFRIGDRPYDWAAERDFQ